MIMKKVLIILAAIVLLYLLFCLFIYLFQQRFVFVPQKGAQPPPDDRNIHEEWITTNDGQKLHAWWMPVDTNAYTVLFFHGNAGNISRGEKRMRLFREMGFNALAIDYRGFGISTGSIKKENDIYEDARASYEFLLKNHSISEDKVIIWGWSMGGAVAVNLAQHKKCHALVMESTFYCLEAVANKTFWFIPNHLLLKYQFLSYEKLSNIEVPVLFVHSKTDETVPYENGIKLYEKFGGKKKFIETSGDHNHGIFDLQEKFIPEALPFLIHNSDKK